MREIIQKNSATWISENPILDFGILGFEHDTLKLKMGDGLTPYNSLPYAYYTIAEINEKFSALNLISANT